MFEIMLPLLKVRNEIKKKKKNGWGNGRANTKDRKQENTKGNRNQKRIQKPSERILHFLIFRLMATYDAIQTTYIRSVREMFPFTSANFSLNHITNNSFSYKTIYAHYPFVLMLFYSVSYTFKGDSHFHWPEITF